MNTQVSTDRRVETMKVSDLHFDPENPRLPLRLRGETDAKVFTFLLRECSLVELMLSIGAQGFFQGEPLLVVPREGGGFNVVEGNRRLAALKLLSSSEPAPVFTKQVDAARQAAQYKPHVVPVLRFGARDEILVYLGYRHITGVNEWGALEKARYLSQLATRLPETGDRFRILAKQIGSRRDYVQQTLVALDLVEAANDSGFFERNDVDPDKIPFSVLTTAIAYKSVNEFVGLEYDPELRADKIDIQRLEQLFAWLFVESNGRTPLGESRNLKVLARVIGNETARDAFARGASLVEADMLTEGPLELVRKLIAEADRKISAALDALRHASGLAEEDLRKATALEKAARHLRASVEDDVRGE